MRHFFQDHAFEASRFWRLGRVWRWREITQDCQLRRQPSETV